MGNELFFLFYFYLIMVPRSLPLFSRFSALVLSLSAPLRPAGQLSGTALRMDAPFTEREAGALKLLRGRGLGRAVAGVVGTVFFEQPNSACAKFGWISSVSRLRFLSDMDPFF